MIRDVRPAVALALLLSAVAAASAFAQPETPSSAPAPSAGAPPPPTASPVEGVAPASGAPDRTAAQAAVRAQCTADRARFCPDASGVGALACLSGAFAQLSPDCQSAVTALKQARTERGGA